jgi:membrane fusion protein, multidrug efflux system
VKLWLLLATLAVSSPAWAGDSGSVQVATQTPRRGSVPDVRVAYGTAVPALDGGMTLSLPREGRILAIAVTPGERVRQGGKLIAFGASAAASSTYQQAVSALALARTQRAHIAQLLAQQLATRDQLAQADKALSDAQSALDAMRREGAGQAQEDLLAPFDGIIATVPVAVGDRLQPNVPLLTLTRLDGLVVTVGVEPAERARVAPGQLVRLQPLAGGAALDGHVLRIDGVLNGKTRLVDADISIPAGAVLSGEAFRAAITIGQFTGWLVPHTAVLTDEQGAYVFQVKGDKAVRVAVQVTGQTGDTDVVDGKLDPGRKLVTEGNYQLDDGATVRESAQ